MKRIMGYIMYVGCSLTAILFHIYTIYWVYEVHGMLWSFISFLTPPFAELVMIGVSISAYGWTNPYFVTSILLGVGILIGDILIKESEEQTNVS